MKDLLTVGDTVDFLTTVADYPASAGYTLKYRLVPRTSGTAILLTATASGDDYRTQASPAISSGWTAGEYSWSGWVEKTGFRQIVESGLCTILPDPSAVTAYDGRSQAQKALDDANTALANFSSTGGRVKRYSIAGREMEFDSAADILQLVNYWSNEVSRENAAAAVKAGAPNPRRIYLRMSNA